LRSRRLRRQKWKKARRLRNQTLTKKNHRVKKKSNIIMRRFLMKSRDKVIT